MLGAHAPDCKAVQVLQAEPPKRIQLKNELGVFFLGLGALLGVLAYFAFATAPAGMRPLWGIRRDLAVGVPFATLSFFQIFSGVSLLITKRPLFSIVGAVASTGASVYYIAMWIFGGDRFPINLMCIAAAIIPFLVWTRTRQFLKCASTPNETTTGNA